MDLNVSNWIKLGVRNRLPVQPFSTLPPPPDDTFVERPEILLWLRQKCERPQTRAALVGPAGVGKSQVALQYAHQFRKAYPDKFVFWVEASTDAHFQNSFRDIASRLQLPGHDEPGVDALPLVSEWLSQPNNGSWLMVIDSAESTDMFCCRRNGHSGCVGRSCLPINATGSILFTSRNPRCLLLEILDGDLDFYNATYKVPVMNIYQAFQLLRNELDDGLGDAPSAMADLVYALGREPRAITHAANVIKFRGFRMSQMSELKEFKDLWPEKHDIRKRSSLPKTWHTIFEQLRQQRSRAIDLLYLMSFFSGTQEMITKSALISFAQRLREFKNVGMGEEFVIGGLNQDIEFLHKHSLVTEVNPGGDLTLAPLVGFCVQMWLFYTSEQTFWKSKLLHIVAKQCSKGMCDNWKFFKKLDACFQSTIALKIWSKPDRLNAATISLSLANHRYIQERFQEAELLLRKVVEMRGSSFGLGDMETIRALNNIGILFQVQGRLGEAERTLRLVLEVREKVLGKEHQDTLSTSFALANVLLKLKCFTEAEKLHRNTLATRLRGLGKDHFHTLMSLDGLGETLRLIGEYAESEKALFRAVEGKIHVLGTENPHTLSSVYGLAATLRCQGKYQEAEERYRQGLEGFKKILGRDHPSTLVGVRGLIHTLRCQKKDKEARRIKESFLNDSCGRFANAHRLVSQYDEVGPMHRCHIEIRLE